MSLTSPGLAPALSPSCLTTEIVERVTRGEQPPFRPSLALQSHLEELGQLMQRCWAEEPQERPPFQQIRLMLRKFNRLLVFVCPPCPTATLCPTLKSFLPAVARDPTAARRPLLRGTEQRGAHTLVLQPSPGGHLLHCAPLDPPPHPSASPCAHTLSSIDPCSPASNLLLFNKDERSSQYLWSFRTLGSQT